MEVKQSEVTQANWDEWNRLKVDQECAVCGGVLDVRTVPERQALVFGCSTPEHAGYRQRTSVTEDLRRGQEVYPTIRDNIEAKMMVRTELNRALNLLQMRYPDSIKDIGGASLFINDCMRLGLDPLIQPAEAVPIAFNTKDKAGRPMKTVAMVITEDGYLSMAARGCPAEYDSAPATMTLLDFLMLKHKERPLAELQEVARRTALELCNDADAFIWVALGKRRSATEMYPIYGYYRQAEWKKAKENKLPAGTQPGNQARVRAVKRWVRETFPECRQKMLEYTAEILRRSEGAIEARRFIDAEYRVLIDNAKQLPPLPGPTPAGNEPKHEPARTSKAARTHAHTQADNKVGESAKRSTGPENGHAGDDTAAGGPGGATKTAAAPSGANEHTLLSTTDDPKMAGTREAAAAAIIKIDWDWLRRSLKTTKWSDGTARSWIKFMWPNVNTDGTLEETLPRLTREQADRFFKEVQQKLDSQPSLM